MLVWMRNILFLLGRFEGTHGSHMTTEGVANVEVVVVRPGKKAAGGINGSHYKFGLPPQKLQLNYLCYQ